MNSFSEKKNVLKKLFDEIFTPVEEKVDDNFICTLFHLSTTFVIFHSAGNLLKLKQFCKIISVSLHMEMRQSFSLSYKYLFLKKPTVSAVFSIFRTCIKENTNIFQ